VSEESTLFAWPQSWLLNIRKIFACELASGSETLDKLQYICGDNCEKEAETDNNYDANPGRKRGLALKERCVAMVLGGSQGRKGNLVHGQCIEQQMLP
jgi:hypothetical protein